MITGQRLISEKIVEFKILYLKDKFYIEVTLPERIVFRELKDKEEVIELSTKLLSILEIEKIPDEESNSEAKNICFKDE